MDKENTAYPNFSCEFAVPVFIYCKQKSDIAVRIKIDTRLDVGTNPCYIPFSDSY
jgi:hypothetical protein